VIYENLPCSKVPEETSKTWTVYSHVQARATHTHTHTQSHTQSHTHAHTNTNTLTQTNTHTRTHARTYGHKIYVKELENRQKTE